MFQKPLRVSLLPRRVPLQPRGFRNSLIKSRCVTKIFYWKKITVLCKRGAQGPQRRRFCLGAISGHGGLRRAAGSPTRGSACVPGRRLGPGSGQEAVGGAGEERGVNARGSPGKMSSERRRPSAASDVSFQARGPRAHWGLGLASGVCPCLAPNCPHIQGNKKFKKANGVEKGADSRLSADSGSVGCAGVPWTHTLCRAQSSWLRSLASPGASAVFSASLARSCSSAVRSWGWNSSLASPWAWWETQAASL